MSVSREPWHGADMDFMTSFLDETVEAFTAFRASDDNRRVMGTMAETIVGR